MSIPKTELEVIQQLKGVIKMHQLFGVQMDALSKDTNYSSRDREIVKAIAEISHETVKILKETVAGVGTIALNQLPTNIEELIKALAE
jgi:hypothetical protein